MELTIIQKRIFEIRGHRVMLDFYLAELYNVETRVLNQAVKRNKNRFPIDFMFQLSKSEWEKWKSQIVLSSKSESGNSSQLVMSSKKHRGSKYIPYVFTEHGVAMLSSVLRSKKAVEVNISIMRAFILLRQYAISHKELLKKIKELEKKYDHNFAEIYEALNSLLNPPPVKRKKVGYKHYD